SVAAVCFDLDDTLCVSARSDAEFHAEVFDRVGVDPIVTPRELRAVPPAAIERESTGNTDLDGIAEFYTKLYRAAVRTAETDVSPDSPLIEALGRAAGALYDPTAVEFRAGAEATLEYVRDRYEVGLITNGTRETQTTKLDQLGIAGAFETTVFCDPARGIDGKPAREPFELALEGLSASAERTLHVGDSHGEDVLGAHNAGLQSAWAPLDRPHVEPPTDPEPAPTYRVPSLTDLLDVL
ncbi:MAG: HAD family hydrolase, partial [Halapricum sp.]